MTLKVYGWQRTTIGHLFYTTSSFVHHFKSIGKSKLELQSGNAQFGSKSAFFVPRDLEIWQLTLKKRPLLCYFKLCASFRSHWWIQTGVSVRKRPIWVKIEVFLAAWSLDGWPWKTTGHFSEATLNFVHHFIHIYVNSKKRLNWVCPLWPWPLISDLDFLHGHHFCQW